MAIYSMSIAAQRMVHTYVSMAGYAAYVHPSLLMTIQSEVESTHRLVQIRPTT
jgi:hypothetical protein